MSQYMQCYRAMDIIWLCADTSSLMIASEVEQCILYSVKAMDIFMLWRKHCMSYNVGEPVVDL